MHEDICKLAENKTTSLIVVPIHKQETTVGGMEVTNPTLRTVNQNVLANAPYSVGILIDRSFGGSGLPGGLEPYHPSYCNALFRRPRRPRSTIICVENGRAFRCKLNSYPICNRRRCGGSTCKFQ
ncbi:hypothetical protein IFM89_006514 [Coptis chinensis]|uniref:Cation/H(+) antiporter central domain-containing protein n=1 Tax=Coptis chinensis TaxID=261450 RepID=A0A835M7J4_9MAGN|nr:hypothetical protein IFM89_006514 [Coptis chinensis]